MNNTSNSYMTKSLAAAVISSATTNGTIVDLAQFVNVGKRPLKLTIGVVDCKSTSSTTTDQTVSVTWYENSANSTVGATAISGAAVSATTASGFTEYNVLASQQYVYATALATGTSPVWGVVASVVALRREF